MVYDCVSESKVQDHFFSVVVLYHFFSSFFLKFQYYKSSIYADLITQKSYIVNLSTILIILVIFILCNGKDSKVLGQIGFLETFDA